MVRDFRSFISYSTRGANPDETKLQEAAFVLNPKLIIVLVRKGRHWWGLEVWADSPEKAEDEVNQLKSRYLVPKKRKPDRAGFYIVTSRRGMVSTHDVELKSPISDEHELALHYGDEFAQWNARFLERLRGHKLGLTIFQGSPGTGKTSYLKYLVHALRRSHRFYYLPVTVYSILTSPTTVDFWLSETESYEDKQKIVIIEDAETLLMQRASDNQESLSNLLNIADGFLGDFLQMHIICTMNAQIDKLDPAVLRPGRLMTRYLFCRLSPAQATRLAAAKGLQIRQQESYSLAEIYNNTEFDAAHGAHPIGFCK